MVGIFRSIFRIEIEAKRNVPVMSLKIFIGSFSCFFTKKHDFAEQLQTGFMVLLLAIGHGLDGLVNSLCK